MINLFIKYLIGKPRIKNFKSNQINESKKCKKCNECNESNNIYKKIYIEMMPYFY